MRISDWSSDVCSSDLVGEAADIVRRRVRADLVEQQEGVEIGQPRPADDAVELDPGAIAGGHRGENALDAPKPGAISGVAIGFADGHSNPPPSCRSEEHTSELQSLMRNSYAVFCLNKKNHNLLITIHTH